MRQSSWTMAGTWAHSDENCLIYAIVVLIGIPQGTYQNSPIWWALDAHGCDTFHDGLLMMSVNDLMDLSYPENHGDDPSQWVNLPTPQKHLVHALKAFYHDSSWKLGQGINIRHATKPQFDSFCSSIFDPSKSIVPWTLPLPTAWVDSTVLELNEWTKRVKPSKNNFKEFKDEATWTKSHQQFLDTLESQGLGDVVDQ